MVRIQKNSNNCHSIADFHPVVSVTNGKILIMLRVFDKEIARDGSNEINGDRFDEVKRMASISDNSTRETRRIRPATTDEVGWQEKGIQHSCDIQTTLFFVLTNDFHNTNVFLR